MSGARILVIGDSHASFFAGAERIVPPHPAGAVAWGPFDVHHVGPGLASSLVERESENNTRAKALEILAARDPGETSAVLLCFGEIDCRFHIRRRAERAGAVDAAALERSVQVTALRYTSFASELMLAGFRPVLVGPPATTPTRWDPPYEWPTLGSVEERNEISRMFDRQVGALCRSIGADYVSILEPLVDEGLRTRAAYYFDGVHLGRGAWPLVTSAFLAAGVRLPAWPLPD